MCVLYMRVLCVCVLISGGRRAGLVVCVRVATAATELQQSCNRAATELQQTGSVRA